jgi:hypothetical protein
VNEAAATVPLTAGKVTPPVFVLVPAGASTTVPATVGLTAMLPKFISTVLEIAIGVITVAEVLAVADTWAKVVVANVTNAMVRAKSFAVAFIVGFSFCELFVLVCFVRQVVFFSVLFVLVVQPITRQNYGDFSPLRQKLSTLVFNTAHTCA